MYEVVRLSDDTAVVVIECTEQDAALATARAFAWAFGFHYVVALNGKVIS